MDKARSSLLRKAPIGWPENKVFCSLSQGPHDGHALGGEDFGVGKRSSIGRHGRPFMRTKNWEKRAKLV
jgi:hypothetical protein